MLLQLLHVSLSFHFAKFIVFRIFFSTACKVTVFLSCGGCHQVGGVGLVFFESLLVGGLVPMFC